MSMRTMGIGLALLWLSAGEMATAGEMWMHAGQRRAQPIRPEYVDLGAWRLWSPSDVDLFRGGWARVEYADTIAPQDRVEVWEPLPGIREMTAAEKADRDMAQAEAAAEAEEAEKQPRNEPTGIRVPAIFMVAQTNGAVIGFAAADDGALVPFIPEGGGARGMAVGAVGAVKARNELKKAANEAKKNGNDKARLAALEALLGVSGK